MKTISFLAVEILINQYIIYRYIILLFQVLYAYDYRYTSIVNYYENFNKRIKSDYYLYVIRYILLYYINLLIIDIHI